MKEVWVLTERSDFQRHGEYDYLNYRSNALVFDNFELAKKAMRQRLVDLAIKDGKIIPDLKLDIAVGDEEGNRAADVLIRLFESVLTDKNFTLSQDDVVSGEYDNYLISSIDADFETEGFTDYLYGFGITDEEEPELICHGYDDGPCNGVNPYIYINCFTMNNPDKQYSFHLDNKFDEDANFSSHLYLDLKKVEIIENGIDK